MKLTPKQIEMLTQRIAGILITLISIIALVMCGNGEDDATGILVTLPLGIYCLVSKKCVVKIFEEKTEGKV